MSNYLKLAVLLCLYLCMAATVRAQRPELIVQTGHPNSVTAVAFMPGDKYLLSAGDDGAVVVWDLALGRQVQTLPNKGTKNNLSVAANGLVLSAADQLKLWDVNAGQALKVPDAKAPAALSPDGRTLAYLTGYLSERLNLLDVRSGNPPRVLTTAGPGPDRLAFSPDGAVLAAATNNYADHKVRLWDVQTGRLRAALDAHKLGAETLVFSPDGRLLATIGHGDSEYEIKLWEVGNGKPRRTFKTLAPFIAFSPDGQTFATVDTSGDKYEAVLWGAGDGRRRGALKTIVSGLAFSPDGRTLAVIGGDDALDEKVLLWDTATGQVVRTGMAATSSSKLVFSSDGRLLASSLGQSIYLWDTVAGRQTSELRKQSQDTTAFALSADGKSLAAGAASGQVVLWDLVSAKEPRVLSGGGQYAARAVAFSPDGRLVAAGGGDIAEGGEIAVWVVESGRKLYSKDHTAGAVTTLSFSADNRVLATGHGWTLGENGIKLWAADTGRELNTLAKSVAPTDRGGMSDFVTAFSAAGGVFARVHCEGKGPTVEVWKFDGTQKVRTLDDSDLPAPEVSDFCYSFYRLAFSPSGTTLARVATAGADAGFKVRLWDLTTGAHQDFAVADASLPRSVTFSPDGKSLAVDAQVFDPKVGREQRGIVVLDIATKAAARTFVRDCAFCQRTSVFSPDGRLLVTGSEDDAVKFLDAASGDELVRLNALSERVWLVASPDGLFDGSPGGWGQMLWRFSPSLSDHAPVEAYFREFFYPNLLPEVVSGKRPKAAAQIERLDRRQPTLELSVGQTPAGGEALATRTARVTVKVTEQSPDDAHRVGSGARDVRLFRDGTLVKAWRGDVLAGKGSVTLSADVPVAPGDVAFTAYAFNSDNVKSRDVSFAVKGDAAGGRGPTRTAYVLAVGVNKYANSGYDLKYAVADAADFGAEWKRQQERLKQYQKVEVVSLLDAEATKANILLAIKRLVDLKPEPLPAGAPKQLERLKYAEPQDAVVIYFAGHGVADGKRFYLIPHDLGYAGRREEVDEAGLRQMLEHSVSDEELEAAFEGLQSSQTVLVIDACNSGQALDAEEKRRGPMNSKGLAQLAYEKGMYVLTASQSLQVANEEPVLGHGYLTYVLIEEGLRRGAADREPADGAVYLREWFRHAEERVPRLHEERMSQRSEEEVAQLRSRKIKVMKLAGVEDVQRPRVFYRRELEAQPLVVAKPGVVPPVK